MANPVAQELRVAIRRILDPGDRRAPELGPERGPMELDERADDPAAYGRDPGEPAHPRALEKTHQHRLRLIVGGMAERDSMGADAGGAGLERGVPRFPSRRLERAP